MVRVVYMHTLTSLEYSFLLNELKGLTGKYFTKAYQLGENKFRFKFGDIEIICEPGVRMNIAKYIEKSESEARGFVKKLREELENKRVKDVYQQNKDRIIVIEFDREIHRISRDLPKGQTERDELKLIFEMFGKGNIILVKGNETVAAMREEQWSDRAIKKGEKYQFPKSNVAENAKDTLSQKYIIVCMMQLPLGKEYVKEILGRCGITEKKPGSELIKKEVECIDSETKRITNNPKPYGFYENGELIDYGLTNFSVYGQLERREFATLSEILDEFYLKHREEKDETAEKLKRRLDEQIKKLEELKKEEIEAKETGGYIYGHYAEIEEILKTAKTNKLEELEEKLKKYKAKVNKKEKEIDIEA